MLSEYLSPGAYRSLKIERMKRRPRVARPITTAPAESRLPLYRVCWRPQYPEFEIPDYWQSWQEVVR